MDPLTPIWLALLALGAALINGAVGYGFSSVITPIAIFWYSNKVLNPALVIVELSVNLTMLYRERSYLASTWSSARPVIATLSPGVVLGTLGLAFLAVNDVKLIVYGALLPLAIVQLSGWTRPVHEKRGGLAIGPGIGFLYALTTISGPPLAVFFRNQGLSKNEFRATMAQVRVAESSLTLGTYVAFTTFFHAGLFTFPSLALLPYLIVPVVVGVPLGTLILRSVHPEQFRRFVMGVDGIVVSYGLSRTMATLKWITSSASYLLTAVLFVFVGMVTWYSLHRLSAATDDDPTGPPNGGSPANSQGRSARTSGTDPPLTGTEGSASPPG